MQLNCKKSKQRWKARRKENSTLLQFHTISLPSLPVTILCNAFSVILKWRRNKYAHKTTNNRVKGLFMTVQIHRKQATAHMQSIGCTLRLKWAWAKFINISLITHSRSFQSIKQRANPRVEMKLWFWTVALPWWWTSTQKNTRHTCRHHHSQHWADKLIWWSKWNSV